MAVDSACSNRLSSLKFLVSPLIGLVILTFDLFTSNLVLVIAREVGNLSANFGVRFSGTFRSRLMGQQLSDVLLDLATLTYNLEGHGACL